MGAKGTIRGEMRLMVDGIQTLMVGADPTLKPITDLIVLSLGEVAVKNACPLMQGVLKHHPGRPSLARRPSAYFPR